MNEPDPTVTRTSAPLSLSAVTSNPDTLGDPMMATPSTPPCIGEYVLLGELGRGGMGIVYRAEDPRLKREVALKVMLPQFAANPQAKMRFVREARAQAKVEHDHVVHILHIADHDGLPYIVMPLLKGMTLHAALKANPRPPLPEVIRMGREVAEGLAAAHEKGLVHRDIKPANIWLEGKRLRVKVLDFGLARIVSDADATEGTEGPVTREGAVVGTPAYMSPEQGRGLPVDGRTDLFSLGVMLYQMTTGELPFRGATTLAILTSLALDNPPPPIARNPAVPQALSDCVMRLLAKDPAYRPPTAEIAAEELRSIEAGLVNAVRVIPLDSPPPLILAQVGPDPFADLDATEANSEPEAEEAADVPAEPEHAPTRKGFPMWALVGGVLLAVAGVVGFVASQMGKKTVPEVVQVDPQQEKPPVVTPPIIVLPPSDPQPVSDPTFFNGKDLTGWDADPRNWRVENGEIVGANFDKVKTPLKPQRSVGDFRISFECLVRLRDAKDGGHGAEFRFLSDGKADALLYLTEAFWLLARSEGVKGSKWDGIAKQTDELRNAMKAKGDGYHLFDLTVVGRQVTVVIDGVRVFSADCPTLPQGTGLMWTAQPNCTEMRVRNIRFADLSKPTDPTFFNSKDLTGWKGDGKDVWRVENGELVGVNNDKTKYFNLYSDREYRDFEMTFDAKATFYDPSMNAGATNLSFRQKLSPKDSGAVELGGVAGRLSRVKGGAWGGVGQTLPETVVKAYKVDGYNSYSLKVVGQRVTILVNGHEAFNGDDSELPAKGIFVWQMSPRCSELRVKNIRFTDLSKPIGPWRSLLTEPGSPPPGWKVTWDPKKNARFEAVSEKGGIILRADGFGTIDSTTAPRKNYHFRLDLRWVGDGTGRRDIVYHTNNSSDGFYLTLDRSGKDWTSAHGGGRYNIEPGELRRGKLVSVGPSRDLGTQYLAYSGKYQKPAGEWNTIELICLEDSSIQILNGQIVAVLVNQRRKKDDGKEEPITEGSLRITGNGAVEYRNIEVRDITALPVLAADPDRKADAVRTATLWFLDKNAKVRINGTLVTSRDDLPAGPFKLTAVEVTDGAKPPTDADIDQLVDCPDVVKFEFWHAKITDRGVETFVGFLQATVSGPERLKFLVIESAGVTDAGVKLIGRCTGLKHLGLKATRVTDAGLLALHGLTELESIHLGSTKVSADGVKKLSIALPKCKIEWDGGTIEPTKTSK